MVAGEKSWGHQSEYGRDDIGTEGLDVEIGNGAIGVGMGSNERGGSVGANGKRGERTNTFRCVQTTHALSLHTLHTLIPVPELVLLNSDAPQTSPLTLFTSRFSFQFVDDCHLAAKWKLSATITRKHPVRG